RGAGDGRAPRRGRRRLRRGPVDLCQSPVRPALRDGAAGQPARGDAGNRVVNPELAGAYAYCERLARTHYENFPVASRLLPAPMRPHIAAVYAFARLADDIADEGTAPPAARQEQLALWQDRIHRAATDDADSGVRVSAAADRDTLVAIALGHSIR